MNSKGQTLVAIVALGIVALSVGITISTRFIKNLRSHVESDNAAKAMAIAESGIERFLIISNETLDDYIQYGSCGTNCDLSITDVSGQLITAHIDLSYAGESEEPFEIVLYQNDVFQLNLKGYSSDESIDVCWDSDTSIFGHYIYEDGGEILSKPYAYNAVGSSFFENGFSSASPANGHINCFSVVVSNNPKKLRIKSFYTDSRVYIVPSPGNSIPKQGILIQSTGYAGDAIKKVKVLKSDSIAPDFFDYVLYQRSESEPLSNRSY